MATPEPVDLLVIGSGEGGKFLAWHQARAGERVVVVERRWIGGSCPNTNCLPSKNEVWSAKIADLMRHADRFGSPAGIGAVDMKQVVARKRAMVAGLVDMHLDLYKESGAELVMGSARLTAPRTVEIALNDGGTRLVTGRRMVLNLGTRATMPDLPGLAAAAPLTHIGILELDRLPAHLVVLGGGYVGLELAQTYRRFGSDVTVIEAGPQIAAREDTETAMAIMELFGDAGIAIHHDSRVLGVQGTSGQGVSLRLATPAGERMLDASDILVAAGRTPNTAGIGLDRAGVALDARGYIAVNDRLETSAPATWALGECAGSPQFTHVSFDDFRVVRDNFAGGSRSTTGRIVPYCMFTDPPLARVGLSEGEAKRAGIACRTATLPAATVLRTRTLDETRGFLKAVVAADNDRILGFTMFGAEAGEVIAVVQTAMLAGLPYTGLRDAILAHPTMAEGLGALFSRIPPR